MKNKYIGVVLIIVGVLLMYWGYDVFNSAGSKISRAFNSGAPIEAWAAMIGGAICVLLGILKVK
ncbi:MAG: DUF3185 family protein [Alcanivoracaceae bacterium]|jgi:uncharacterized membrane protein YidH (DUF202 family)|nr:DUF3185 family protein [Alcanivoracaceae bacterium]